MRFRKVKTKNVPAAVKEAAEGAVLPGNGWRRIEHRRNGVVVGEYAVMFRGRHAKSKNWHGAAWFYGER